MPFGKVLYNLAKILLFQHGQIMGAPLYQFAFLTRINLTCILTPAHGAVISSSEEALGAVKITASGDTAPGWRLT